MAIAGVVEEILGVAPGLVVGPAVRQPLHIGDDFADPFLARCSGIRPVEALQLRDDQRTGPHQVAAGVFRFPPRICPWPSDRHATIGLRAGRVHRVAGGGAGHLAIAMLIVVFRRPALRLDLPAPLAADLVQHGVDRLAGQQLQNLGGAELGGQAGHLGRRRDGESGEDRAVQGFGLADGRRLHQAPVVGVEADRGADADGDLVELGDGGLAEVDASPEGEQVEIGLHVSQFLGQGGAGLVEGEVAALDLLDQVGRLAQLVSAG